MAERKELHITFHSALQNSSMQLRRTKGGGDYRGVRLIIVCLHREQRADVLHNWRRAAWQGAIALSLNNHGPRDSIASCWANMAARPPISRAASASKRPPGRPLRARHLHRWRSTRLGGLTFAPEHNQRATRPRAAVNVFNPLHAHDIDFPPREHISPAEHTYCILCSVCCGGNESFARAGVEQLARFRSAARARCQIADATLS